MCGICGVVRFDGRSTAGSIEEACRSLRHRGPDHCGIWHSQSDRVNAVLAATRLAVLDPRVHANQPFHRNERFHLVYNGEVYNFRELRAELIFLGETFVTDGDTEVVLAVCARWGVEALSRLDGMFALAFFDSAEQTGFLARDPVGIKPLMYAVSGGELAFASELRALVHLGAWRKDVDAGTVVQHLVFGYIADPATIYRAAWRLPPAHYLAFGPSGISEPRAYHEFPATPETHDDYESSRTRVRRLIGNAVARQRVSDVPVGAFLSGGLDSSIVVSHLAQATPQPVHTFCVGYADSQSYDERKYARVVACRFGTRHEEIVLGERDVLEAIPKVLDHMGEPVGDSSIVPTSLVSWAARQFVTVALSGDGGDELFGGYWRYLAHQTLETYLRIPGVFRRGLIEPLLSMAAISRSSSIGNRVRQFRKLLRTSSADALTRHVAWSRILPDSAVNLFIDPSLVEKCIHSMIDRAVGERGTRRAKTVPPIRGDYRGVGPAGVDPLNAVLRFDLAHQLPADMLHKVDLAGMMHSLEVRVPLLDRAVVEAALPMPSSYKIYRGLRKRILVDAYRGHLPDEVLDRPKQGFEVPVGELLRGPLREMFRDTVRKETVESFGLLSYSVVESIYSDHENRRADHADLLWAILSLCWWQT
jgi:asparagine synthase (glutamine-hydrolysing)